MYRIGSLAPLALIILLGGCAGSETEAPAPRSPVSAAAQTESYAVPAGAGDIGFTVACTMAAVRWAKLDAAQQAEWRELWDAAMARDERPVQGYPIRTDGATRTANLFERSAKDGFCVSHAHDHTDRLRDSALLAYFRDLSTR